MLQVLCAKCLNEMKAVVTIPKERVDVNYKASPAEIMHSYYYCHDCDIQVIVAHERGAV